MHRFASLGLKLRIDAAFEPKRGQPLQRFPSSPPEIKNHCTNEGTSRQNPAVILKSEPEIKNRCTQKIVFGEILAAILKSGSEIKNHCTLEGVLQAGHLLCGNEN